MSLPTSIDARAVLRLGIAPLLVIAYSMAIDYPLPLLPAVLTATILATSAARPPLALLVALAALVFGITLALATVFTVISSHPLPFWTIVLVVTTIAFARLDANPADLAGSMMLTMTCLVTVLLQFSTLLPEELTKVVGSSLLIAIAAVLLAHALLPSPAAPQAALPNGAQYTRAGLRPLGQALGLVTILILSLQLDQTQALLISVTVGPILAIADRRRGWQLGIRAVLANMLAFAIAMPALVLLLLRSDGFVALLAASAASLLLARRAIADGPMSIAAITIPTFVVVLARYAPTAATDGEEVLTGKLFMRLSAVMVGVAFAMAVHVLLAGRRLPR